MGFVRNQRQLVLLLLLAWILTLAFATNFPTCSTTVEGIMNGLIPNDTGFDIFYHGNIRGLRSGLGRPVTLTLDGCEAVCGTGTELNTVLDAFEILTTWVLPAVGLVSQLPYESLSKSKQRNVEAFLIWVGSPAAALTSTIFNIWTIRKAQYLVRSEVENDAYFVLTCIYQYDLPYKDEDTFPMLRKLCSCKACRVPLIVDVCVTLARYVPLMFNACAFLTLLLIMMFQITNGLNSCVCKSSIFGAKSYGGYMDFQNAQQYRIYYPVGTYWISAAVFGGLNSFFSFGSS